MSLFRALHRKNPQMFQNPREEERKRLVVFINEFTFSESIIWGEKKDCRKHFIRWCVIHFFSRVMLIRRLKKTMLLLVLLVPQVSVIPCDVCCGIVSNFISAVRRILCIQFSFCLNWVHGVSLCGCVWCVHVTRWRGS